MYIIPSFSSNLAKEETIKKEFTLLVKKNRLLLTGNHRGINESVEVIAFSNEEEEASIILNKKIEDFYKTLYFMFGTRTITFLEYNNKKIEIEDETEFEKTFIVDDTNDKSKEMFIIPATELPSKINTERWSQTTLEKINSNPNKMVILFNDKNNIIWLDEYVLISELKKQKGL